jgi:hypothetical protein
LSIGGGKLLPHRPGNGRHDKGRSGRRQVIAVEETRLAISSETMPPIRKPGIKTKTSTPV